ncbi:MAG: DUF1501 domain-containing protein [Planctomycetaceae bacterium]|nr:DUF1501 domain-containing protein [Planctomycetaceae bacterium]
MGVCVLSEQQSRLSHPRLSRRTAIQAGAIGWLGLGMSQVTALKVAAGLDDTTFRGKSVIYIFLSGGLAQHDSFDMKPDAPEEVRGEFKPIATATPGLQICEHLPLLAQRSQNWALCRSMTHNSNEHSQSHHIMLTGRTEMPRGFSPNTPQDTDWPSIAAIAKATTRPRNGLPPAAVLPERLVHYSGRVIPGQFAGMMGQRRNPWFIEAAPFHSTSYGAFPEYQFDHQDRGNDDKRAFKAPNLELPHGLTNPRFQNRIALVNQLSEQREALERSAETQNFDRFRQGAISLLTDPRVQDALDVTHADDKTQERYGKNAFGWSLLMARRLVGAGVNMVQVNLGNDEAWDTHGNAFPHLKDNLFPPTDRAVSALLDDLSESGMLDDTLIVMAGEFGRTPKITLLPNHYKLPGRDHWGAVQSVWLAGGGVQGGRVIGASDKIGAYPADSPQRPENLAATIYNALGIPPTAAWYDQLDRPHHIYHGEPIRGLS